MYRRLTFWASAALERRRLSQSRSIHHSVMQYVPKRGCEFISVSENIETTTAPVYDSEPARIVRAVRARSRRRAYDGCPWVQARKSFCKRAPFGFGAVAGVLVADDAKQAIVVRIVSLTAKKNVPTEIRLHPQRGGLSSPQSSTWCASSVEKRSVYSASDMRYHGSFGGRRQRLGRGGRRGLPSPVNTRLSKLLTDFSCSL